jgi:rhamnose utilization protein RhaD (predicted bifunctional aldolase and dehydrogenase)
LGILATIVKTNLGAQGRDPTTTTTDLDELVELSLTLGLREHDLVILAEGNTSRVTLPGRFAVKVSGAQMSRVTERDFVELHWEPLVAALRDERTMPADVKDLFREASPGVGPGPGAIDRDVHPCGRL